MRPGRLALEADEAIVYAQYIQPQIQRRDTRIES